MHTGRGAFDHAKWCAVSVLIERKERKKNVEMRKSVIDSLLTNNEMDGQK